MWALVFEKIDSDFAPYSFSAHDAGHIEEKKTEMPLELCDNGKKNMMQLCFINCQLHQNPFLLKVYLYLHISSSQYPEKVYEYFTIWRNSLEVN